MAFTPPVSPNNSSFTEDEYPYFRSTYGLECNAENERRASFNNQSLLKCGEAALITKPELLQKRNNSSFVLFDLHYEADSQSSRDLERLFFLARKRLCVLAAAPKSFGATRIQMSLSEALSGSECADFRRELKEFFLMLRYFLACQDEDSKWIIEETTDTIIRGLSLLRLELGWLTDLPRFVLEYANGAKSSAAYQLFHAHLELRWFEITVLYYLLCSSNKSQVDFSQSVSKRSDDFACQSVDMLKEKVLTTVVDLIRMAVARFNSASREDLVNKSMFNCPCVKELWLLFIIFIDKIHEKNDNKHPFWSIMDEVVERLSSSEDEQKKIRRVNLSIPAKIKCENPSLFCLWILSNLTQLFLYDDKGNLCKNKVEGSECNYLALKRALTQLTEGSQHRSEEERRVVVHLVCAIVEVHSDPKPDAIMILWDFFFRSLNLPFQLPNARAGNFAVLSDTPRGLLDSVIKISGRPPSVKTSTSYDAFLHLLGNHLDKYPLHWKQKMRGRVFSKLSPRKVSSMSELGLLHLVQLFFTVAIKTDLEDMAYKLNEILASVDETCDSKRRTLAALARLAMVILMAERGVPFGRLIRPLLTEVSLFVSRNQLEIPRIFVDAIKDIMECNVSLELDQHLIVGDWMNEYLQRLSHDSYHPVLDAFVTIMKKLRDVIKYGSTDQGAVKVADALRLYMMPFVKQQMASNGPAPFLVADLAAHFTFLSLELRSPNNVVAHESFTQLIKKFVENDGSNIMLIRRYLWLILTEKQFFTNIVERCSEQEYLLIAQAWIRISLFSSNTNNEEIREVTYQILRLPTLSQMLNFSWEELERLAMADDPFISLIESLGRQATSGSNLADFRRGVGKIFEPIAQWLRNVKFHFSPTKSKDGSRPPWNVPSDVMGQPSKEAFSRLYYCMGTLLLKCHRIIFTQQNADCLLVKSLPPLLLPTNIYDIETQLSVQLDEAVRSSLHLFVIGLFRLDPFREPCIRRYFRDLVINYLPRMTTMGGCLGGSAQKNPFLLLWNSGEHDAEQAGCLVVQFVAEVFMNADRKPIHTQHSKAVNFIEALLKNFPTNENLYKSVITHIVPAALEISTKSNEHRDTYKILPSVLNSILYTGKPTLWPVMDSALNQLSSKHLSFNPDLFFKLLTKLVKDFGHLVKRFLPSLKKNIEEVSKRRGLGSDHKLQGYYDRLSKTLE